MVISNYAEILSMNDLCDSQGQRKCNVDFYQCTFWNYQIDLWHEYWRGWPFFYELFMAYYLSSLSFFIETNTHIMARRKDYNVCGIIKNKTKSK